LFLANGAFAGVIDPFTDSQAGFTVTGTGLFGPDVLDPCANCIGGTRQLDLNVTANPLGLTVQFGVSSGVLNFSNPVNGVSIGTVTWNSNGGGLGGIDLTSAGAQVAIQVEVLFSDLGGTLTFGATDTFSITSSKTVVLPTGAGSYVFPFAGFLPPGTDFTLLDQLTLTISGPAALDVNIDLIETVPEPSTLILFGVGLVALVALSRRR
jgi:hypothetical protein